VIDRRKLPQQFSQPTYHRFGRDAMHRDPVRVILDALRPRITGNGNRASQE
jgi:hypothetical protein